MGVWCGLEGPCRLQPMCEVVQRLLQVGLMGVDLLRTFVSHHVQPLRQ
jgi:hypothetical protein